MKVNQLKTGVILSYVQMGLGMIISIIYTPFMLRFLGQSEYGLYNISSSVIAYLSVLNFGFGSAYIRYYSKYKCSSEEDKIRSLNGLFMAVFCGLGLIAFVCGIVLALNVKNLFGTGLNQEELETIKILMLIMAFNMGLSFPASVFVSFITANERFVFQKLVNMIKTVFSPFVTLLVLFMGFRSIGMTLVVTAFALITDFINFLYCRKKLNMSFDFKNLDLGLFKEIAGFSGFIAINLIVDEINWNVDKFLLGRFQGSIATAIYGVAATLNSYYRNISASITNVFTPRIHKMINSDSGSSKISALFTKVGRIQFMLLSLVWTGFIFFGKRFILVWAGENYSDAYFIVMLLIIPVTFTLIQGLGIEVQRAKNMHKFRSFAYGIMAVINVVVSIPLCIHFSGMGVAAGTAISIIIGNVLIMNWYYYKKIGLDIPDFWKNIFKTVRGMLIPVAFGLLVTGKTIECSIVLYLALIATYVVVYSVSIYILSMNAFEKELVRSFLKRLHMLPNKAKE